MNVKYMVICSRCLICAVESVYKTCFGTNMSEDWNGKGHIYKSKTQLTEHKGSSCLRCIEKQVSKGRVIWLRCRHSFDHSNPRFESMPIR